jgi:predicted Ser/Thr protein kinase
VSSIASIGTEIAGYRVESILGQGGMGTVYLARTPTGGVCALKVLSQELVGGDSAFATRFEREVRYAEALNHPNVLEIYESGEAPDGSLFFAMQYVDGPDLGALLRRGGPLGLPQALTIVAQVGDALDAAHAVGLIHRDVNPGNIIVANDPSGPHAYLTDFGLSKHTGKDSIALTRAGQMVGTLPYTAPEEILAGERDHRVDVYSLGCVLYEALTGAPPFVRERDIDVLYAHLGDPRPSASEARPDLPPGIDEVMATAMAVSPSDRYASCGAFIAAAQALVGDAGEALPPVAAAPAAAADRVPAPEEPPARDGGAPPGTLRLVAQSGFCSGRELLVDDELLLGRLTIFDGALAPDHSISRRHARILRTGDGFAIQDEHSRNGTFVNGERIEGPHVLRTGDEVQLGATSFVAEVPKMPVDAVPAADAVVAAPGASKLALRLELDAEAAELTISFENGPTARIVREGEGWRVEAP